MTIKIPKIPNNWPYLPRTVENYTKHYSNIYIPGLSGLWQLELTPSIDINVLQSNSHRSIKLINSFGRGGVFKHADTVIRPYRRGGLLHYINDRYYCNIERFQQEFFIHKNLWSTGFPTVEPLGWGYKRETFFFEGIFLSKFTNSKPWPIEWSVDDYFLIQLCEAINALCYWGLYAPDLNATNILIGDDKNAILMDWDKSHWVKNQNLKSMYIKRLVRSIRKMNLKKEIIKKIVYYLK